MKYYRIPEIRGELKVYTIHPGDVGWKLRHEFIPGELVTPGEWKRYTQYPGCRVQLSPAVDVPVVEVKKSCTYWFFGCRQEKRHCQNCGCSTHKLVPYGMLDVCPACRDGMERLAEEMSR